MSERKDFLNGKIQALQDERAAYAGDQAEQIRINGTLATFQKELDDILATEVQTQEDEQAKAERIEVAKGEAADYFLMDETFKEIPPIVLEFVQLAVAQAVRKEQEANELERTALIEKYNDKIKILIDQGMETEDQLAQVKRDCLVFEEQNTALLLGGEEVVKTIAQLTLERDQALQYRDNAAEARDLAEEESKKSAIEILRLESQIAEYQAAKVFGEKESQRIIEVTATDKMRELAERITKQYKVNTNIGLYTEVEDAEGNKEVISNKELENLVIVESFEAPTFQEVNQEEFRAETVDETQSGSESGNVIDAGQAEGNAETQPERRANSVSREEFDELKADVEALKRGRIAA